MRTLRLRLEIDVQADGDQLLGPAIGKAVESLHVGRLVAGEVHEVSAYFESGVQAAIHVTGYHQKYDFPELTEEDGEPW